MMKMYMTVCYNCVKFNEKETKYCMFCGSTNIDVVQVLKRCEGCDTFTEHHCPVCYKVLCGNFDTCKQCYCQPEEEFDENGN